MKNEPVDYRMGIFGDKKCKYCGQKKTMLSTYACSASPSNKHVWVKA